MTNYPSNIEKIIESIVNDFGLFNKSKNKKGLSKVLNEPDVILSELVVRYKKTNLSEEKIISFLINNLKITREKAEKVKNRVQRDILSKIKIEEKEGKEEKTREDKYREHIE
jgi:hypothetical protein